MKKKIRTVPGLFPMPVILIATYNEDGTVDVMNAAWGCAYDTTQIQLNISESHKTTENIRRTGVFTVTVADASHVAEADYVGLVSASQVKDKFARTGLKAHKSDLIDAPILDDFAICMECKSIDFQGEYGVLGEILRLSVDEEYLDKDGKVDVEKLRIIAYDPFNHGYYVVDKKVGNAFSDGRKFMK
ncbi:MAG: flavin reductase family protein [Bacilli bacterium]|nr:flavin reductase family protein [Bacilli bacterium]